MIELQPRDITTGHLGVILRVTQPSAYADAGLVVEGPLVAVEHRLMHPKIGTIRTHLQIGTHSIETNEPHTRIEMYGDQPEDDTARTEDDEDPDPYMAAPEIAELLNVSRAHAHRLLRTRAIPGTIDASSGTGRKAPRVRRSDLLAWVDSREVRTEEEQ